MKWLRRSAGCQGFERASRQPPIPSRSNRTKSGAPPASGLPCPSRVARSDTEPRRANASPPARTRKGLTLTVGAILAVFIGGHSNDSCVAQVAVVYLLREAIYCKRTLYTSGIACELPAPSESLACRSSRRWSAFTVRRLAGTNAGLSRAHPCRHCLLALTSSRCPCRGFTALCPAPPLATLKKTLGLKSLVSVSLNRGSSSTLGFQYNAQALDLVA